MDHLIKALVTVLLPPVGVLIHEGVSGHLVLNIILTLFGYFPGLVHGLWRVLRGGQ